MITLTILGCGNMGRAFAAGLLSSEIVTAQSLTLVERREDRCISLKKEYNCGAFTNLVDAPKSEYLLLAIKPQDLQDAADSINAAISGETIVISILAGVSLQVLQKALNGHARIIRAMPNLPAIIAAGMTAFVATSQIKEEERAVITLFFSAVGEALELKDEQLLNGVTAISGSGPAYLYYFLQAWRLAAQDLGFSEKQANRLICQTVKGATELWEESDYNSDSLRQRVTSKGGTTEAAQRVLEESQVAAVFRRAINRAAARAEELELLVKETL